MTRGAFSSPSVCKASRTSDIPSPRARRALSRWTCSRIARGLDDCHSRSVKNRSFHRPGCLPSKGIDSLSPTWFPTKEYRIDTSPISRLGRRDPVSRRSFAPASSPAFGSFDTVLGPRSRPSVADTSERRFSEPERRASTSATFLDARARCETSGLSSPALEAVTPPRRCAVPSVARRRATSRMNPAGESHGAGNRRRRSSFQLHLAVVGFMWAEGLERRAAPRLASSPPRATPRASGSPPRWDERRGVVSRRHPGGLDPLRMTPREERHCP